MKQTMQRYFERTFAQQAPGAGGALRCPWDPDVEAWFWVDGPDDDDWAAWRPVEKHRLHDLATAAPDLPAIHRSLHDYFNSWWFCTLEGAVGQYGVTLEPVLPGLELDSFVMKARGYMDAHGGVLDRVPIGIERNGLLVVVDNHGGKVLVEDFERRTFEPLAPSLEALIDRLEL
jgi:SecY interacting protein Syd